MHSAIPEHSDASRAIINGRMNITANDVDSQKSIVLVFIDLGYHSVWKG